MNYKSFLIGLGLFAKAVLPSFGQDVVPKEISNKPEVSAFIDLYAGNGFYFMIGPKSGTGPSSNFALQGTFGTSIDDFTIGGWFSSDATGKIHETDIFSSYSMPSLEFSIKNQNITLESEAQLMAFMYPGGSPAGDATDFVAGLNLNASTTLINDLNTSLNANYLHNVVRDEVQRGGALILDLNQEILNSGRVSLSGNLNTAFGTGLYDFKGHLLTRPGISASINVSDNVSVNLKYEHQIPGKKQDPEVIPNTSIWGGSVSFSF